MTRGLLLTWKIPIKMYFHFFAQHTGFPFSISSYNDNVINTDNVRDSMEMSFSRIYFGKHWRILLEEFSHLFVRLKTVVMDHFVIFPLSCEGLESHAERILTLCQVLLGWTPYPPRPSAGHAVIDSEWGTEKISFNIYHWFVCLLKGG